MANYLIIYSSTGNATNIKGAADCFYKYPEATVKDVTGITTGNITTYITGLTDTHYDEIFIYCVTQDTGATGLLSFQQVANLQAKMKTAKKGTVVVDGTSQTNTTATEIVLDSDASSEDDTYNGMFIKTTGTTAVIRYISDYVGSTKTCTVPTTTTAISGETYEIYTLDYIHQLGNVLSSGKTPVLQGWDLLYPTVTYPIVNIALGGTMAVLSSGTAQSVDAGTITLAANKETGNKVVESDHDSNDYYNGKYVYIYSASTGACQFKKITDYVGSTHVATLESNWGITPTGTVIYRVVDDLFEVYLDRIAEIMTSMLMYDITAEDSKILNQRLIDDYGTLSFSSTKTTEQDLEYIMGEYTLIGKNIFKADALGVV